MRRFFRALFAALSETPPDDDGDQLDAVLTVEAVRDWAENVRDSRDGLPEEYRHGMCRAAADVLRILDAG